MSDGTTNIAQENTLYPKSASDISSHIVDVRRPTEKPRETLVARSDRSHGLFHFLSELRRRRVCRAATMYAVALWLICQVVEIVAPELGLPEWTLKIVIVFGMLGFPFVLLLSWLIEITPNGLVIDDPDNFHRVATTESGPRHPPGRILDCGLILAALIIALQLAAGVLTIETIAAETDSQKIAVVPFRVASGNDAAALSEGLLVELQHELATQTRITVIAPRDLYLTTDSSTLTGAVSVGQDYVRVTATMINNETGAVTWSRVFERPRTEMLNTPAKFAGDIVTALPASFINSAVTQADHAP